MDNHFDNCRTIAFAVITREERPPGRGTPQQDIWDRNAATYLMRLTTALTKKDAAMQADEIVNASWPARKWEELVDLPAPVLTALDSGDTLGRAYRWSL